MKSFMELLIKEIHPALELLACLDTWYISLPKCTAHALNMGKNMINAENRRKYYKKSL